MVDRYEEVHDLEIAPAWQYNFVVRVNDTLDMMAREEELFSWNLMVVGDLLNKFIYVLFERLGLTEYVIDLMAMMPAETRSRDGGRLDPRSFAATDTFKERTQIIFVFVTKLLGSLEFLDAVEDDPALVTARDCLIEFFTSQNPMSYKYFPTNVERLGPKEAASLPVFSHRMFA
jgi:hypothetical protein